MAKKDPLTLWALKYSGVTAAQVAQWEANPNPGLVETSYKAAAKAKRAGNAAPMMTQWRQKDGAGTGYQSPDMFNRTPDGGGIPVNVTGPAEKPLAPPPLAPDASDELLQTARRAQMLRARMGMGRRSTFLTGPMGAATPALNRRLLGG